MNFNFYLEGNSFLHKVNPALKYIMMIMFIFSLTFSSVNEAICYIILIQLIILLNRLPYIYIQKKMLFIIPLTLFTAVGLLLYPLLPMKFALVLAVRIYLMLSVVLIVNMTTPLIELLGLFSGMIRHFVKQETAQVMAMIFLLVINFIPLVIGEIAKVNLGLASRQLTIKNRSIKKNIFYLSTFVQSLVNRLDVLIDEYELVFYARNISVENIENIRKERKYQIIDFTFIVIVVVIFIAIKKFI